MDFCQATVGTVANIRFQFIKTVMPAKERYPWDKGPRQAFNLAIEIAIVFLKRTHARQDSTATHLKTKTKLPKDHHSGQTAIGTSAECGHISPKSFSSWPAESS